MTGPANERLERKRGIRAGVDGFVGLRGDTATPIIEDAKPVRGVVTLLGFETVPKEKEVMLLVPQTISLKLGRMVGQTVGFWVRGLRQCKHTTKRISCKMDWPPAAVQFPCDFGGVRHNTRSSVWLVPFEGFGLCAIRRCVTLNIYWLR